MRKNLRSARRNKTLVVQASACGLLTFLARTNLPQMIERINPRIVPVAPLNPYRVVTHFLHMQHFERRLKHLEWILLRRSVIAALRLRAMRPGAGSAGAFVAKVRQRITAMMAVLPVDLDALRLGYRDVFRFRLSFNH